MKFLYLCLKKHEGSLFSLTKVFGFYIFIPMKQQTGIGNPLLIVVIAVVIISLLFGGYQFMTGNKNVSEVSNTMPAQDTTATPETEAETAGDAMETSAKSFTITGSNFAFAPNVMKVKKGDTVKITFNNSGGMHDLVIDGYDVATKVIGSGKSEELTFVADKAGTFEFYCSVGNHRAMGMKGQLVVE
jgi:cytochrome c oxidase subunit 2